MGIEALLTGKLFRDPLTWVGITHCRFDMHPQTNGLVVSIARKGQVRHIDVPLGVTLTAAEIYELIGKGLGSEIPPAPDPCAIAQGFEPSHGRPKFTPPTYYGPAG